MGNLIRELEPPVFANDRSKWAQLARTAPAEEPRVYDLYKRLKKGVDGRELKGEDIAFLMILLQRAINDRVGAFNIRNLATHGIWVQLTSDDIREFRTAGMQLECGPDFFQILDLRMMNDLGRKPDKLDRSRHIGITTDGTVLKRASAQLQEIKGLLKRVTSRVVAENNERHASV